MDKMGLGKVSLTPRGRYDASAKYTRLDVVEHDGGSYIVLKDVIGVPPTVGDSYMLLAKAVTPERGVDYWTEADKAEIKSYIDDAILGGKW